MPVNDPCVMLTLLTPVEGVAAVVSEPDKLSPFTKPLDVEDPEPASLATV